MERNGQGETVSMESVKEYVELLKAPWGKMFYDLLFIQLHIPETKRLRILDFGSGLGMTANYFAKWHDVTAIEPNTGMIDSGYRQNPYMQICGGIEILETFDKAAFDIVFCHNVLEYIQDKAPVIAELFRVLKPGGTLSLIKHNRIGKVFANAVFQSNPKKAISLLDNNANDKNNYLGTQYIYSNEDVKKWMDKIGGQIKKVLGIRTFWALGQDNAVKYTEEWYQNMLALESAVAEVDEYRNVAYFHHLLIEKMVKNVS